jgi:hypothetical protein
MPLLGQFWAKISSELIGISSELIAISSEVIPISSEIFRSYCYFF